MSLPGPVWRDKHFGVLFPKLSGALHRASLSQGLACRFDLHVKPLHSHVLGYVQGICTVTNKSGCYHSVLVAVGRPGAFPEH